ncbi:hypothetical protein BDF20DRAFT_866661 [Mycotypha africana]|uniref:uncharacterized protein n=1 Tax=Mycotypha africana TaxID=64632 RepID=UPI002301F3C8|nr:uncharacterized protein BDF20DRAFT_866661 [Mycotypha africana]KAI8982388.1 hypothetical protein BDF20DRAFT_866661 [Mycotypha africana]
MSSNVHLPRNVPPPITTPPPAPPSLLPLQDAIAKPPVADKNTLTDHPIPHISKLNDAQADPIKATAAVITTSTTDNETTNDRALNTEEHSAHLNKYLKEVRRHRPGLLHPPTLADFQVKSDDNTVKSTKWLDFIEAWILYVISSAAYDELDRPLEPFSLNTIKHDVDRLYPIIAPLIGPARKVKYVYRWENKALTGALASFYLILWYYDLVLAFATCWLAAAIIACRLNLFTQYGVEVFVSQPEVEGTAKSWNRKLLKKMNSTQSASTFNIFDHLDVMEWKSDITTKYGPKIQMMFSDTVDYVERFKNLLTWKRPAKTRFLLILVLASSLFLSLFPVRFIAKFTFFYMGFEFFVLQALRSHYPRHRRLFNILNLLLWDVPNDAEYALEVVRLSQSSKYSEDSDETAETILKKSHTLASSDSGITFDNSINTYLEPLSGKFSASMSDLTDHLTRRAMDIKPKAEDRPSLHATATTTATSLAMLAAAAAANKVRKSVNSHAEKKKKETEEAIANDDDPNAFGCIYKGTIPGRIKLGRKGFIFRTARMAGARVLVECAYKDIIGVKKTKQYNMLVWHGSGIDISMADGMVLKFENVLRRDECFNRLVIASGKEGGEWKKM